MSVSRVAVLLLTALLALPAAGATLVQKGNSPWDAGYPQNPQQYCILVYDVPGEDTCEVRGNVQAVYMVRVRIVGEAKVHVGVLDNHGPLGIPEQRAVVDCSRSCVSPLFGGPYTDDDWTMTVDVVAWGEAVVQVSLESRSRFAEQEF